MKFINRFLAGDIERSLENNPVTAIIGARQVGKSTLAKVLIEQYDSSLYIDLEKPSDRVLLTEAEAFFSSQGKNYLPRRDSILTTFYQVGRR